MELRSLSNEEFIGSFERVAASDRKIMSVVLQYICEAERREIYDDVGLASMFDFMTIHLKYSAGAASRRINAAKILRQVPEVNDWLKTGDINVSQLSMVNYAARRKEKLAETKIEPKKKREILEAIKSDPRNGEQIVAKMLDLPIEKKETKKIQQDGSMTGTYSFTPEETELYRQIRLKMSHVNPNPTFGEVFAYAAKTCIGTKKRSPENNSNPTHKATSGAEVTNPAHPGYISAQIRREVEIEQPCCRWKCGDGTLCESEFQLQIDHITSVWAGGDSRKENLQRLCAKHNRMKYRREANIRRH